MKPTNYIGYHVGDVDDLYDHSSEDETFNDIWKKANHLEMKRGVEPAHYKAYVYEHIYDYETNNMQTIILDYGDKDDMWNLERDLHNKHNVDISDKYFNQKKSLGAYPTIQVDDLLNLKEKIQKGFFTKSTKESIIDLYKELIPKRLQNRTDEDDKFVNEIRDDIIVDKNTDTCEPIRVRVDKDGKRKMFDGNTTLMAAYKARKVVNDIEVDEIPYSVSCNFNDDEFNELGVLLNEKPKKTKRACKKHDVAQVIYKRCMNDSTPVKDPKNKEYIEAAGWKPSLVYEIVRSWINKGKMVVLFINYNLDHNKKELTAKVDKYKRKSKDTDVLWCSSGAFGDGTFMAWLAKNTNFGRRKPKFKKLYIVIYHPNEKSETDWDDKNMSAKKKELKYLCGLAGVSFMGFKYMDTH